MRLRPLTPAAVRLAAALALVSFVAACGGETPAQQLSQGAELAAKGDHSAAIIRFKSALQQQPEMAEARLRLGESLFATGQLEPAMVELEKAAATPELAGKAVPRLAAVMVEAGDYKRLVHRHGKTRLGVPASDADMQAELAKAYMGLDQPARAQEAVEAALKAVPDHPEARLLGARMIGAAGNLAGALELTDRVLKQDPRNARGWLFRGELAEVGQRDRKLASEAYRKAIELAPGCVDCHAALITMHLRQRDTQVASQHNEVLRKVAPGHAFVALMDAYFALSKGELEVARERAQTLLKVYPDNAAILSTAAAVESRLGLHGQAVAYLAKATNISPKSDTIRLQLAEAEVQLGRPESALNTLAPLLTLSEAPSDALAVSGSAHLKMGNVEEAERAFTRASKSQPDNLRLRTSAALARLGSGDASNGILELRTISERTKELFADEALLAAHLRRREFDAALEVVERMAAKGADAAQTGEMRGRVEMLRGDLTAARKSLDKAVAASPSFFPATGGLSTIDALQGKPQQAVERLRAYTRKYPEEPRGWLALAAMTARHTQEPLASVRGLYDQAIKASPGALEPRRALVDYLSSKGRAKEALAAAEAAAAALPADAVLLDLLGTTQLRAGESEAATSTFRQLAGFLGDSPQPYLRLAQAYVAANRRDQAEIALRKAIDIDPSLTSAQSALVDLLTSGNRVAEALQHVRRLRETRPSVPVGYAMESIVMMRQGDARGAMAVLRQGLNRAPGGDLAERLVSILVQQGQLAEAERVGIEHLKKQPDDINMEFLLSGLSIAQGNLKLAEERLRRVVGRRPNLALALNNLAAVVLKRGGPTSEAVALARRAIDQLPDEPAYLDTLASALEADGQIAAALTAQRSASDKAPDNHGLRLRLAELALLAGDRTAAKAELDKLARLGASFPRQDEVRRLSQGL